MAYCDEYLELISAAVDGALSPAQRERLEEHLASCPECQALYGELTALHTALLDLPPVEVPADLTERIMNAVAAEQVLPFAPAEKKKSPVHWQRWMASAAVLAVVLMGVWGSKPWERSAQDLKTQNAELQEPTAEQALPQATQAAPESVSETAMLFSDAVSVPPDETAPAYGEHVENGENFAAKASADAQNNDIALPAPAGDIPRESPEESNMVAPRISRMAPVPVPEDGGGDPVLPTEVPEETEIPEENETPEVQPFMVTSMQMPNETAEVEEMTAREALDILLENWAILEETGIMTPEIFSAWQLPSEEELIPGWTSPEWLIGDPNSPYCSRYLIFVGLNDIETTYWFAIHQTSLSDEAKNNPDIIESPVQYGIPVDGSTPFAIGS